MEEHELKGDWYSFNAFAKMQNSDKDEQLQKFNEFQKEVYIMSWSVPSSMS